MAVNPSPFGPKPQIELVDGTPAVGGKLFFYVAASVNTKRNTYTDSTGGVANANPLILNSLGQPATEIWFTAGQSYKVVYAPSTDTDPPTSPIWSIDNLFGINDATAATPDEWLATGLTPTFVSTVSFTLAGDQTSDFTVGRRVKAVDAGGTKYGTILTSAFGALTTITLDMDSTQVLQNPVSAVSLGILRSSNSSIPGVVISGGGWMFQTAATLSPAQITANQNDYAPVGLYATSTLRINTDASRNITGLTEGGLGHTLLIHNVGTFPAVFTYEDGLSAAVNRFAFGCTLGGGQSMEIQYDPTSLRWRAKNLSEPLGTVKDFGMSVIPAGYLLCDGTAVSRSTYASLFNVVGVTWGVGDGVTTFNVPDARRNTSVGSGGAGTGTLGNAVGNVGGAETHALSIAELAAHTHPTDSQGAHTHTVQGGTGSGGGATPGVGIDTTYTAALGGTSIAGAALSDGAHTHTATTIGSGTAHNNIQPSMVITRGVRYC